MFTKAFLIVLFGTALVLANPVPESEETAVAEFDNDSLHLDLEDFELFVSLSGKSSRGLKERWEKIKRNWENLVEKGKAKYEEIKKFVGEKTEVYLAKLNDIKTKGLEIIEQAQTLYFEIKSNGKQVFDDLKVGYGSLKEAFDEAKKAGLDTYEDFKGLLEDVQVEIVSLKEQLDAAVKTLG